MSRPWDITNSVTGKEIGTMEIKTDSDRLLISANGDFGQYTMDIRDEGNESIIEKYGHKVFTS